jgi:hypothetical protein
LHDNHVHQVYFRSWIAGYIPVSCPLGPTFGRPNSFQTNLSR